MLIYSNHTICFEHSNFLTVNEPKLYKNKLIPLYTFGKGEK